MSLIKGLLEKKKLQMRVRDYFGSSGMLQMELFMRDCKEMKVGRSMRIISIAILIYI